MKENETICQDDKTLNAANKTQELLRVYSFLYPLALFKLYCLLFLFGKVSTSVINITGGKRAHNFLFIQTPASYEQNN